MAQHAQLRIQTGLPVYFCDPHSPWQRGTNENTNGLLRQYFPKGTDLSRHSAEDLDAVAATLNSRPRKTLGWRTPAEALDEYLAAAADGLQQRRARGYRRSGPRSGRASATTAASPISPHEPTSRHSPESVTHTLLRGPVEPEQYTSFDYTQALNDHRVLASIGTVGDAYDNALAESFVDSFKTELIKDRVWQTRSQLELAILEYVAWFNNDRLHESLGDRPPAEVEAEWAALNRPSGSNRCRPSGHLRHVQRAPLCTTPSGSSPIYSM